MTEDDEADAVVGAALDETGQLLFRLFENG